MFNTILSKTLWERRKSIFFWSLGLFLYVLMLGLLYPSIEGIEAFATLTEDMPDAMKALIGEIDDFTSPAGFLGGELYGLTLPLVLSILAISFGASAISKEEESGTLELLLASPLPRGSILMQKAAAMAANLVVVGVAVWLSIAVSTLLVEFDIGLVLAAWATLAAVLLALCFGLLALTITALGGGRGLSIGIATVLFIVSYFANTLAVMVEAIEPMQNISLLYYYDGAGVLRDGPEWSNFFLLLSFIAVAYTVGHVRFRRRDTGA